MRKKKSVQPSSFPKRSTFSQQPSPSSPSSQGKGRITPKPLLEKTPCHPLKNHVCPSSTDPEQPHTPLESPRLLSPARGAQGPPFPGEGTETPMAKRPAETPCWLSSSRLGERGVRERPVAPNTRTQKISGSPRGPPCKAELPHLTASTTQLATGL